MDSNLLYLYTDINYWENNYKVFNSFFEVLKESNIEMPYLEAYKEYSKLKVIACDHTRYHWRFGMSVVVRDECQWTINTDYDPLEVDKAMRLFREYEDFNVFERSTEGLHSVTIGMITFLFSDKEFMLFTRLAHQYLQLKWKITL